MNVLFLVVSYHTVNFFKKIIKDLESKGCRVRILAIDELPFGAKEDGWDTHQANWHMFDWRMLEGFDPDRIVVFNGYFRKIHAASIMLKQKYPTIFAEVAWFPQKDYIYLDTDILHRTEIAKVDIDFKTPLTQVHFDILDKLKKDYRPSETIPYDLPEEFILLPLQLERDTSIVYASDIFKDMNSLVGYVRNNSKGIPLVVKTHPKGFTDELEENLNLIGIDHLIHKGDVSMNDLVSRCTLLTGINSTSLMEALLHHKPILQFGNNIVQRYDIGPLYKFSYFGKLYNSVEKAFNMAKGGLNHLDREYMDRTILHLYANQIPFRNPPSWAAEKIINFNSSPRGIRDIK